MSIVFRSKILDHTYSGNSYKTIQRRGADWSNLRIYDNDDTRDIAWSRSNLETIYVKERQNQWAIRIIGVFIGWLWDDFFIESSFESKWFFLESAMRIIQKSATKNNYTYTSYIGETLESVWKKLQLSHTKNNLILIFRTYTGDNNIPPEILKISSQNDIIFVDIFHPFELNPIKNIMIEGKIFSQGSIDRYKKELSKNGKMEDVILSTAHISHIQIKTNENLESRLNYFFKERYHG